LRVLLGLLREGKRREDGKGRKGREGRRGNGEKPTVFASPSLKKILAMPLPFVPFYLRTEAVNIVGHVQDTRTNIQIDE